MGPAKGIEQLLELGLSEHLANLIASNIVRMPLTSRPRQLVAEGDFYMCVDKGTTPRPLSLTLCQRKTKNKK
jgi:hypothetical protein